MTRKIDVFDVELGKPKPTERMIQISTGGVVINPFYAGEAGILPLDRILQVNGADWPNPPDPRDRSVRLRIQRVSQAPGDKQVRGVRSQRSLSLQDASYSLQEITALVSEEKPVTLSIRGLPIDRRMAELNRRIRVEKNEEKRQGLSKKLSLERATAISQGGAFLDALSAACPEEITIEDSDLGLILTKDNVTLCARALRCVKYVNFLRCKISDAEMQALSRAIEHGGMETLESLLLPDNAIGDVGISEFADAALRAPLGQLGALQLGRNRLTESGVRQLCIRGKREVLPTLGELWLNGNDIVIGDDNKRVGALSGAFPTLTLLHIGDNPMGETGVVYALGDGSSPMKMLRILHMNNVGMGDGGLRALCNVCVNGGLPHLEYLDLLDNPFRDVKCLTRVISGNVTEIRKLLLTAPSEGCEELEAECGNHHISLYRGKGGHAQR
jgi:hypothetical protein